MGPSTDATRLLIKEHYMKDWTLVNDKFPTKPFLGNDSLDTKWPIQLAKRLHPQLMIVTFDCDDRNSEQSVALPTVVEPGHEQG